MKNLVVMCASALMLAACGGGSGNPGPGNGGGDIGAGLTHNQLADAFVKELNATGAFRYELVKSSTDQANFLVVKDGGTGQFHAININGFSQGDSAVDFHSGAQIFKNLIYHAGGAYCDEYSCDSWEAIYQDRVTGVYFEKVQANGKDLEKFAALAEEAVIDDRAEAVAERFGLSVGRGREVVRLAMAWKKKGGRDLSERDQNAFSTAILGFSISEAKAAAIEHLAGNKNALNSIVQKASAINETSPETVKAWLSEYFGVN